MNLSRKEATLLAGLIDKASREEALSTVAFLIMQHEIYAGEIGKEMEELYSLSALNELRQLYERTSSDAPEL